MTRRKKLILGTLCVLLLIVNGYHWFQGLSLEQAEQARQILLAAAFLLVYVILPFGMVVAWIYGAVRRVRTMTRKKEPWEIGDEIKD